MIIKIIFIKKFEFKLYKFFNYFKIVLINIFSLYKIIFVVL